jgi:hypothetical protein
VGTFSIGTSLVPISTTATITASVIGSTATATLVVNPESGTTFSAGLAMISLPYDYPGISPDVVLGYTGVKLAVWNPDSLAYAITPTAPADNVRLGVGYWIRIPASGATLTSPGTPANTAKDFAIPLAAGWNQIGDPFFTAVPVPTLYFLNGGSSLTESTAVSSGLIFGSLYSYDGSTGFYNVANALTAGTGDWIYAYSACTLMVPHP